MKIYVIRHGETNYNVERRYQGMWGESRLTENGKAQAEAAKALVSDIPFDRIYSSASVRTRETSALLFPEREDILFSDDMREIDVGSVTNLLVTECRAKMPEEYKIVDATYGYTVFGGESTEDIAARAKSVIERVIANGGEKVAIVSHGGFIRYLFSAALDVPVSTFALCDNCGVSLITVEDGKRMLKFYNRVAASSEKASDAL